MWFCQEVEPSQISDEAGESWSSPFVVEYSEGVRNQKGFSHVATVVSKPSITILVVFDVQTGRKDDKVGNSKGLAQEDGREGRSTKMTFQPTGTIKAEVFFGF